MTPTGRAVRRRVAGHDVREVGSCAGDALLCGFAVKGVAKERICCVVEADGRARTTEVSPPPSYPVKSWTSAERPAVEQDAKRPDGAEGG
jgi:hypothetical protein